jgi:hypothetical protein
MEKGETDVLHLRTVSTELNYLSLAQMSPSNLQNVEEPVNALNAVTELSG